MWPRSTTRRAPSRAAADVPRRARRCASPAPHALAQAQAAGGDPLSTGLLFALSELESRAGRFHEARELAIRGLTASEQTDQRTERTVLLYVRALAEAHLGAATAVAPPPRRAWPSPNGPSTASRRRRTAGRSGTSRSPPGRRRGVGRVRPVVALLREGEVGELGVLPVHAEAIDALLMLGDVERARALAAELDAAARWPWLRAAAARCRGLLLAAEGDTDAALRELAGAVEQHRALDMPFALPAPSSRSGARSDEPSSAPPRGRRWPRPRRRSRRWAQRGGPTAPAPRRRGSAAAGPATTPSSRRPSAASPSWPRRAARIARSRESCSSPSARWRRTSRASTASSACARGPSWPGACRKPCGIPHIRAGQSRRRACASLGGRGLNVNGGWVRSEFHRARGHRPALFSPASHRQADFPCPA